LHHFPASRPAPFPGTQLPLRPAPGVGAPGQAARVAPPICPGTCSRPRTPSSRRDPVGLMCAACVMITRERELVTLVRTNAQIAVQPYISVRMVSSHLDRIRDKTGCRRRADLTRRALTAGLV
jgi:DNA-binding CsgD family transcriptional regulator